jgi:hypothetical protein
VVDARAAQSVVGLVRIRQTLIVGAMVVTAAALLSALLYAAWSSAATLSAGCAAFLFLCRHDVKARETGAPHAIAPWLDALQGRDPFDSDATHDYQLTGFVTTFVVALSAGAHPLLGGQRLVVFRDEIDAEQWRALVTHIRHGDYRQRQQRKSSSSI